MKDKNIEEILDYKKIANSLIINTITYYNRYELDFESWDWREKIQNDLREELENALQKAKQQGRLKELDILEAHINTQIYQQSINTGSLLQYISNARENIIKNS